MPGKKSKKGKKKGKGKGKKGGKSKANQITAQEAIVAYQINVAEKKLEDILYETRGWEEKIRRNHERNERLKKEQDLLLRHLFKTNRDNCNVSYADEVSSREDVTKEMMLKWQRQQEREKGLEQLKKNILKKNAEIDKVTKEVLFWKSFRDSGQHKQQMQIKLLQQEINDIETSFMDMEAYMSKEKEHIIEDLEKVTQVALVRQQDKASQKAMAQMNKYDRQEVLDNEWIKREVVLHRAEVDGLQHVVEQLERENLELMSDLFECSVEDLKVSRSFYLTQVDDSENLEQSGILEMDLQDIKPLSDEVVEEQVHKSITARPRSAIQKAVEDKVLSIIEYQQSLDEQKNEEDDLMDSESGIYDNYYFEEENFEDYLKLGPLELKLLSITGHQKPIHEIQALSKEEMESKQYRPDNWPVTTAMLQGPLVSQREQEQH